MINRDFLKKIFARNVTFPLQRLHPPLAPSTLQQHHEYRNRNNT